jgi:hypothetical protein
MDARITLIDGDYYGENGERGLLVIKRGLYINVQEMEMIDFRIILNDLVKIFSTNRDINPI